MANDTRCSVNSSHISKHPEFLWMRAYNALLQPGHLQGWAAGTEQLSDLHKGESAGLEELNLKAGAELQELTQLHSSATR